MANFVAVSGNTAVASAGTAVILAATTVAYRYVRTLQIKADSDNAGTIFVGNDDAGDVTTGNGYPLIPGETLSIDITSRNAMGDERLDISSFWIDSASGTPSISWIITY